MTWVARARRNFARSFLAVAATFTLLPILPASAAETAIVKPGDAAVTGFAGTKVEENVPEDVHPLDRTFIDLDGAPLRVFDLSALGTAPRGQLADVAPKLQIKARDIGQVFGVALDDGGASKSPNIYATATSMFGLQLVSPRKEGGFNRQLTGGPDVEWMPGQFGAKGTPGSIYKIDGKTGAISLFATIKNDGRDNAGPGLGNITFDPKTKQVFISDLETGLIHRITMEGTERDVFDHGTQGRKAAGLEPVAYDSSRRVEISSSAFNVEDSATWGFADERRRVFGLAVAKGRLYYAVTEGPSVWSVSIDDEGDFGDDARIELELKDAQAGTNITSITFDGAGMMYLASRGSALGSYDYTAFANPGQTSVVRFRWDEKEGRWAETAEEYAIGLKPDYRNAVGGVALNYGYDKRGNIDFGKCRQTVWSTGEHLREGEDPVRVSTGGAKYVHGLQGNYKSRVRPQNEPPQETWFTDYDGRYEDAEAYGHVGALAIHAPCQSVPAYESSPSPQVTPEVIGEDPPYDDPGLIVDKRCYAGAIGGKIRCEIVVRNVGDHLPVEDVKITDVTRILAGPGAGTVVPIVSVSVPNPLIACAAAPTPDFWCSIPAALLPPATAISIDVWVDTHDLALAGNLGFRNCAVLKHPDGYAKACAEGGTDIVVEKIGPGVCLPGGPCKFGLRIANTGLMPYEGDVLLADAMFVGGAVTNAPITSVNPPVACSAGDMNQLPFTCQTHLALAPGEEHIHWVEVTMPAPGGYWAENCFGVLDPALVPPGPLPPPLLSGGGAGTNNPSCVWVHVPVPKENLKLTKKGTDPLEKCQKAGDDLICKYDVTVTNENSAAYNGPINIQEKVPAGANLLSVGAPWGCAGVPPAYVCNAGGPVVIPPGGSLTMPVTVTLKVPAAEALGCTIPNEAKLSLPAGGAAGNLDPGDDTASATEWTWGISWEDPITHATIVVCDPTNLKVTKKVSGPAIASDGGYTAAYDVTVTNMGPDPYKGPLKLDETFSANVSDVSAAAPFSCTSSGSNYKCETGVIELAKGDSLTMHITARIDDDGTCRLQNTAELKFPVAGSKGNGNGADDKASATASIPSRKCAPKTSEPPVTLIPVPRCPDGRIRRLDGACPCPLGSIWNANDRVCENPEPRCYDDVRRRDDGTCCPRGTYFDDETGRCRIPQPICPDRERRREDGTCCPFGTVASDFSGRCVRIEIACPPDTRWNYITRDCEPLRPLCPRGERFNWRTRQCESIFEHCPWGTRYDRGMHACIPVGISCPDGTHWSRRKQRCVKDHDDDGGMRPCPRGEHWSRELRRCVKDHEDDGANTCPKGEHWSRVLRRCVKDQVDGGGTTTQCPDGSPRMAGGGCRCPQNKRWNAETGSCERPDGGSTGPVGDNCPDGTHRVGRACVKDGDGATNGGGSSWPTKCPEGQHRVGKLCLPDRPGGGTPPGGDVKPIDCPDGQHRVGRVCVPDRVKPWPKAPDVKPVPPKVVPEECPDGTHRVGRRCVPDRVIKKQPQIEVPKKMVPKSDPPRVKVPKFEKPEKPVFKRPPQLEKFKKNQEEKPGKVWNKILKKKQENEGGGQGGGGGNPKVKKFRFN